MASPTFDYGDYHRTVIGFHGTDRKTADDLVNGSPFKDSASDDDWFGKGAYFWEYAPKQAWWWARKIKKHANPAVIGAIIRLGNCFDLLDPANVNALKEVQASMVAKLVTEGSEVPVNRRQHRNLDCAVFNFFYQEAEQAGNPIDSARAVYVLFRLSRIWKNAPLGLA